MNWVRTHRIIKFLFPKYLWSVPNAEKKVYLTFDDGPIPEITEWVLNLLKEENIPATFFCIGDNIKKHPDIFKKVIAAGHSVGNHTFNHLKGWKTSAKEYIQNFEACEEIIVQQAEKNQKLFRPPYGKIKPSQARIIRKKGYTIVMWDIITYDFEANTSTEVCIQNVVKNVQNGSIIVFHDSKKAWPNLQVALPEVIKALKSKGFEFGKLD